MRLLHSKRMLFPLLLLIVLFEVKAVTCADIENATTKFELAKADIDKAKALYPKCRDILEEKIECGRREKAYGYMDSALGLLKDQKGTCPICPDPKGKNHPVDCSDILNMGHIKSGVYTIWPKNRVVSKSISVYCDLETDGGGWTVIQRRGKYAEQISFYRNWDEYKKGFGNLEEEFWLGNDNILTLTNQGVYSLRFDLTSNGSESKYSVYNSFWIGDEWSNYVLHVNNVTGNVDDYFSHSSGFMFSTYDRQNDFLPVKEACATVHEGAWWYPSSCGHLNLNGVYKPGVRDEKSTYAWSWLGYEGLKSTQMMIRHRYSNS